MPRYQVFQLKFVPMFVLWFNFVFEIEFGKKLFFANLLKYIFFVYFQHDPFPASFYLNIFIFYAGTNKSNWMHDKEMLMSGFEPGSNGFGSDRFTNCATAQNWFMFISFLSIILKLIKTDLCSFMFISFLSNILKRSPSMMVNMCSELITRKRLFSTATRLCTNIRYIRLFLSLSFNQKAS